MRKAKSVSQELDEMSPVKRAAMVNKILHREYAKLKKAGHSDTSAAATMARTTLYDGDEIAHAIKTYTGTNPTKRTKRAPVKKVTKKPVKTRAKNPVIDKHHVITLRADGKTYYFVRMDLRRNIPVFDDDGAKAYLYADLPNANHAKALLQAFWRSEMAGKMPAFKVSMIAHHGDREHPKR